jgi:hypothetical protein
VRIGLDDVDQPRLFANHVSELGRVGHESPDSTSLHGCWLVPASTRFVTRRAVSLDERARKHRLHGVRRIARVVLLVLAFICFVVAVVGVPSSGSGRQAQAWIATGLALLTAALLVADLRA